MPAYSVVSRSGGGCSAIFSWLSEKAIVVYTRPPGFVVRDSSGVVDVALKQEHMFYNTRIITVGINFEQGYNPDCS